MSELVKPSSPPAYIDEWEVVDPGSQIMGVKKIVDVITSIDSGAIDRIHLEFNVNDIHITIKKSNSNTFYSKVCRAVSGSANIIRQKFYEFGEICTKQAH